MGNYTEKQEQMQKVFDKALELLKPLADKYKPFKEAIYITETSDDATFFEDGEPAEHAYETENYEAPYTLCYDCKDIALEIVRRNYEGALYANPERFPKKKVFGFNKWHPMNNEGFITCEICMQHGDFETILDEADIIFWKSKLTDIDIAGYITNIEFSWELSQTFIYNNDNEQLVIFAERIIKAFEQTTP